MCINLSISSNWDTHSTKTHLIIVKAIVRLYKTTKLECGHINVLPPLCEYRVQVQPKDSFATPQGSLLHDRDVLLQYEMYANTPFLIHLVVVNLKCTTKAPTHRDTCIAL